MIPRFLKLILIICFLSGCSPYKFPVDKDLQEAILMDLKGHDYRKDNTHRKNNTLFVGIVFNYTGSKDSLLVFHQDEPTFQPLPENSGSFAGFWQKNGICITIVNSLPQDSSYKSHVVQKAFNTCFDDYVDFYIKNSSLMHVVYDGSHYRTLGKYQNGRLVIIKSGWFYDP